MSSIHPWRYALSGRRQNVRLAVLGAPRAWTSFGDQARRVAAICREWEGPGTPGVAIGVFRSGKLLYSRGFGIANLARGTRISERTQFVTGSLTKQFTALAVLLASRDGVLSLNDSIRTHVPELPAYADAITIRHLLQHTSGLRDYNGLMAIAGRSSNDVHDNAAVLRLAVRQRALNFPAGHAYTHSNTAYVLLAIIVERATGREFPEHTSERIFAPLGMRDTGFRDLTSPDPRRLARAYALRSGPGDFRIDTPTHRRYGAGGLITSIRDLQKWDENFSRPRVGSPEMFRQMETHGALANGQAIDYGLGIRISAYRGARLLSHIGADGGYRVFYGRLPERQLSVACLSNLASTDAVAVSLAVLDVFLDAAPGPPESEDYFGAGVRQPPADTTPVVVSPEHLARCEGDYWSDELDAALTLRVVDGQLHLTGEGAGRILTAVDDHGVFRAGGVTLAFASDGGALAPRLLASVGRVRGLEFQRTAGVIAPAADTAPTRSESSAP